MDLSSSGLGVLIWAHQEMASSGRRLILVNVHSRTRKLLEISKVDNVLELADSVKEAVERP